MLAAFGTLEKPEFVEFLKRKQSCVTWSCTNDYFSILFSGVRMTILPKGYKDEIVLLQNEVEFFSIFVKIFAVLCMPLVSD